MSAALSRWRFAPAAAWAGGIYFASSFDWRRVILPKGEGGLGLGRLLVGAVTWALRQLPAAITPDKAVHAVVFGLLALWIWLPSRAAPAARGAWAVGLATGWGALDEVHQAFVPGRSSDGWDLLADGLGAVILVAIASVVRGWYLASRRRSLSSPVAVL